MAHPAGKIRKLKSWLTAPGYRVSRYAAAAVVAAACGTVIVMSGRPGQAVSAVSAVSVPGVNGRNAASEPEALLFRTLHEINNKRLEATVTEIDKLIAGYPNFRLAHLVKGDLLLASTRPITTLGNTNHVPQERLNELREEARARHARYQYVLPSDRVPRYLVQLQPKQRYALVVDTARSSLYVFENRNGDAQYVADYYVSIGKNGIDKYKQGYKKTPLGVYHVTASLSRSTLVTRYGKTSGIYGDGAFPISYPNEWDRRQGREGYGIWLHGTPSDTYSRPPRSSDGCVALTNQDLEEIRKNVQIGLTPVIIASGIDWVPPGATRALRDELAHRIESWRRDWESLDTENYLGHYAAKFSSGKLDLAGWSKEKRRVNAGKTWIKLKLDRISIFLYPGRDDLAVVTFSQDYASSNLANRILKRQYWIRDGGAWRIIHESAA